MADGWIKMRGALLDHPKVVAVSRCLQQQEDFREWLTPGGGGAMNGQVVSNAGLRCVTVGALLKMWSIAREHGMFDGADLLLPHSTLYDLDTMAGVPGIANAMWTVGWAVELNGDRQPGIKLPNFKEYNVPLTPAEKQSAYRARQITSREGVGAPKGQIPQRKRPRAPKPPTNPIVYPEWLPMDLWVKWLAYRRSKGRGKAMTDHAQELAMRDLGKWRAQGQDVTAIIERSIMNGWEGLFELGKNGTPPVAGRAQPPPAKEVFAKWEKT